MILDFTEIPQANKGGGLQDTFELFTRDFLQLLGYRIIENPDRGPDGKRDLIVDEILSGINSEVTLRWLVSCKHYAPSGKAVSAADEINILERLDQHGCDGFMGVYSTLPAASLTGLLEKQNYCIFDHETIESRLLSDPEGLKIAAKYFPESYKKYFIENPEPVDILGKLIPLQCDVCKKNLLAQGVLGFFLQMSKSNGEKIDDIAFCCAGYCDNKIQQRLGEEGYVDVGSWQISDLTSPAPWIKILMDFIEDKNLYSDKACEKMRLMFIRSFPYIVRYATQKEKERQDSLRMIGFHIE